MEAMAGAAIWVQVEMAGREGPAGLVEAEAMLAMGEA